LCFCSVATEAYGRLVCDEELKLAIVAEDSGRGNGAAGSTKERNKRMQGRGGESDSSWNDARDCSKEPN